MADLTHEQIGEIVQRRFGSLHDKPCEMPSTLTCALWECQVKNLCKHSPFARRSTEGGNT